MADKELKACPFCGNDDPLVFQDASSDYNKHWTYHVECGALKCEAQGAACKLENEAIAAWNTRAEPAVQNVQAGDEPMTAQQIADGLPTDWLQLAQIANAVGHEYWKAAVRERGHGALQCLHSEDGSMFIFTRGEYREQLESFLLTLPFSQTRTAAPSQPVAGKSEADCYSHNDGDSWCDCPDDIVFVHGLKVGDEYEVLASVRAWPERYRVTKAPDNESDDYEVERITTANAGKEKS